MRIYIFCEDYHGVEFFKKLIQKLKKEKCLQRGLNFNIRRLVGMCNPKIERLLKAASYSDKIILIVDADGRPINEIRSSLDQHIPQDVRHKTFKLIFPTEVEEWICISMNLRYRGNKPSEYLKHSNIRYEKYMLPSYADKLDISRLKNDPTFSKFLEIMNDP